MVLHPQIPSNPVCCLIPDTQQIVDACRGMRRVSHFQDNVYLPQKSSLHSNEEHNLKLRVIWHPRAILLQLLGMLGINNPDSEIGGRFYGWRGDDFRICFFNGFDWKWEGGWCIPTLRFCVVQPCRGLLCTRKTLFFVIQKVKFWFVNDELPRNGTQLERIL